MPNTSSTFYTFHRWYLRDLQDLPVGYPGSPSQLETVLAVSDIMQISETLRHPCRSNYQRYQRSTRSIRLRQGASGRTKGPMPQHQHSAREASKRRLTCFPGGVVHTFESSICGCCRDQADRMQRAAPKLPWPSRCHLRQA